MKKRLLLFAIISLMFGAVLTVPAGNTFARPADESGTPEDATEGGIDGANDELEEGEEGEKEGGSGDGYDACDNVLPGGHIPPGFCEKKDEEDLMEIVKNVLSTVYMWVGIISVIMIIIGGVNYTLSQGDPGKVKKARDTILYAIIGLIVSLCAFAITQFVLNAIKGA